jgi:transaldolase/glucose-6-phosphate isomerase
VGALLAAGHPVVRLSIDDLYDLGGQFFLWEMATAVAGHRLGINPFDQPDVEAAKAAARRVVDEYRNKGKLPRAPAVAPSIHALAEILRQARHARGARTIPQPYIALLAYVQPTAASNQALQELRATLRARTGLAVTVGYGPRYLHSTGQLHKGDAGRGLFVFLTADDAMDVPIPDEPGALHSSITFGVLKAAQAEGDRQALEKAGRKVTAVHLGDDVVGGLRLLGEGLV